MLMMLVVVVVLLLILGDAEFDDGTVAVDDSAADGGCGDGAVADAW